MSHEEPIFEDGTQFTFRGARFTLVRWYGPPTDLESVYHCTDAKGEECTFLPEDEPEMLPLPA